MAKHKEFIDEYLASGKKAKPEDFSGFFLTGTPLDWYVLQPEGAFLVAGSPGSGKTTLVQQAVAHHMRYGTKAVIIDVEGAWLPKKIYGRHEGDLTKLTDRFVFLSTRFIPAESMTVISVSDRFAADFQYLKNLESEASANRTLGKEWDEFYKQFAERFEEFLKSDKSVLLLSLISTTGVSVLLNFLAAFISRNYKAYFGDIPDTSPALIVAIDSVSALRNLRELLAGGETTNEGGVLRARDLATIATTASTLLGPYGVVTYLVAHAKHKIKLNPYEADAVPNLLPFHVPGGSAPQYLVDTIIGMRSRKSEMVGGIEFRSVEILVPKNRNVRTDLKFELILTPIGWSIVANLPEAANLRKDVLAKALFEEQNGPELRDALYWTSLYKAWEGRTK